MKMEAQIMTVTSSDIVRPLNQKATGLSKRPSSLAYKTSKSGPAKTSAGISSTSPETSNEKRSLLGGKRTSKPNAVTGPSSAALVETQEEKTSEVPAATPILPESSAQPDPEATTLELKEIKVPPIVRHFQVDVPVMSEVNYLLKEVNENAPPVLATTSHETKVSGPAQFDMNLIPKELTTSVSSSQTAIDHSNNKGEDRQFVARVVEGGSTETLSAKGVLNVDAKLNAGDGNEYGSSSETSERSWDLRTHEEHIRGSQNKKELDRNGRERLYAVLSWRKPPLFILIALMSLLSIWYAVDLTGGGPCELLPT